MKCIELPHFSTVGGGDKLSGAKKIILGKLVVSIGIFISRFVHFCILEYVKTY